MLQMLSATSGLLGRATDLAATGVNTGWLIWPAVAVVVLGIIAVVIVTIVRRRRT